MNSSIRFQQRFENFEKAYLNLDEVVNMGRDDFSSFHSLAQALYLSLKAKL